MYKFLKFRTSKMDIILFLILVPTILFLGLRWFERANIWIPSRNMAAVPSTVGLDHEDVWFESEDGIKLNGWYVPAEKPVAAMLFCHGNAGNISHRLDALRQFHSVQINVFIFDYRGYGRSEGRPSEKGTYLDAMAAYRWLKEKDPNLPLILFGRSLGAAIAVDLATKVDASILICESGFTSIPDLGRELFPWLPVGLVGTVKYDSLSKISSVNIPVLINHSTDDTLIPYSHAEKLYEAAPEPKFLTTMRGGHNEGFLMEEEEYLRGIIHFVNQHCLHREIEEEPLAQPN